MDISLTMPLSHACDIANILKTIGPSNRRIDIKMDSCRGIDGRIGGFSNIARTLGLRVSCDVSISEIFWHTGELYQLRSLMLCR